jgi:hypothetical protein
VLKRCAWTVELELSDRPPSIVRTTLQLHAPGWRLLKHQSIDN